MKKIDVAIIGAGPAGIGISAMLADLGVKKQVVFEKNKIGNSFENWPQDMRLITPSFTTNFFGHLDLNAIVSSTSPAYMLQTEHPTGKEYAHYLKSVSGYFKLPVVENTLIEEINYSDKAFNLRINGSDLVQSKYLIWAGGEFQTPNLSPFKGAENCIHNSQIDNWKDLKGDEFFVLGGFESGIDSAINLSKLNKTVHVIDRKEPWVQKESDPSLNLSPFTMGRLRDELLNKRINLFKNSEIKNIKKQNGEYLIKIKGIKNPLISRTRPILATGFKNNPEIIKNLFDWDSKESFPLITSDDESTKTPGLFLVGPQVRHDNLIFCFIYKYRQRFGVVANSIGKALGLDTDILESYKHEGLYLDDLSCCSGECLC